MSLIRKTIITSLLTVTIAATAAVNAQSASKKQEDTILNYARNNGVVAGGAKYCKVADDLLEEYIAKTNAQIAFLARDDYQKVLGRLEFKNTMTAATVKKPKTSCDDIIERFKTILRESR